MELDLSDIETSLEKLEENKRKQKKLTERLYNRIIQQESQANERNRALKDMRSRLKTVNDLNTSLQKENRVLREKIEEIEDEFLTFLRQQSHNRH